MNLPRWYALVVRHQHERQLERRLREKNLETLVPLYRARRAWSDRTKQVEAPLFAGYVFCRFAYAERIPVLNTPGVRKIVQFGGTPVPVEAGEVEQIRTIIQSRLPVSPWPYLKPGDLVRIDQGPLSGIQGTLLREKNSLRLVIGVELLQRSIAVELDPEMIVPVPVRTAAFR
jgi:transcription antitermination factor NusG